MIVALIDLWMKCVIGTRRDTLLPDLRLICKVKDFGVWNRKKSGKMIRESKSWKLLQELKKDPSQSGKKCFMMSMMNYRLIYSKFYSIFPGGFIAKLSSPKVLNILGIILKHTFQKTNEWNGRPFENIRPRISDAKLRKIIVLNKDES